jgi:hypothetical protein
MSDIDISGIDRASLLAALYNGTSPIGMGFLAATSGEMCAEEAANIIAGTRAFDGRIRFDYVKGRPIKAAFNGDTLERADLYDRDAGEGAALAIIEALRSGLPPPVNNEDLGEKLDQTIARAKPARAPYFDKNAGVLVSEIGIGDEPALSALRAARAKFQ